MSTIIFDKTGERYYETGVDHGVLYPKNSTGTYDKGVAWNGLINVHESPSGAEANPLYADNIKYLNLISREEFGGSIEAYTYPDEFSVCDGSAEPAKGVKIGQQTRKPFGFSYRTILGNDIENDNYGYKIHIVYEALATPSEKGYTSVNESPEAITFNWEFTTTPIEISGYKPTATLTIETKKVDPTKLKQLEDILYGTEEEEPRLPLPDEIINIFKDEETGE